MNNLFFPTNFQNFATFSSLIRGHRYLLRALFFLTLFVYMNFDNMCNMILFSLIHFPFHHCTICPFPSMYVPFILFSITHSLPLYLCLYLPHCWILFIRHWTNSWLNDLGSDFVQVLIVFSGWVRLNSTIQQTNQSTLVQDILLPYIFSIRLFLLSM